MIHASVSPRNKESRHYKHDSAWGTLAQICWLSLIKMIMIGLYANLLFLFLFMTSTYKNVSVTNMKPLDGKADTMNFLKLENDCYFKKFHIRKYILITISIILWKLWTESPAISFIQFTVRKVQLLPFWHISLPTHNGKQL